MQEPWEVSPHLKTFMGFLAEFNKETPRGSALLAASMLDDLLGNILKAFLVPGKAADALVDGFNAPFGTFASKIAGCAALGLISDEERAEIERIRKIRNEFGHGLGASFQIPSVKRHCDNLTMCVKNRRTKTRGRFTTAAVSVILDLINRAHYVGQKRLTAQEWPI
jgi:hypothetical protein